MYASMLFGFTPSTKNENGARVTNQEIARSLGHVFCTSASEYVRSWLIAAEPDLRDAGPGGVGTVTAAAGLSAMSSAVPFALPVEVAVFAPVDFDGSAKIRAGGHDFDLVVLDVIPL